MHNHDTAKDDVLEAIFEILDRYQRRIKKEIEEWKKNKADEKSNLNTSPISQENPAKKNEITETVNDKIKENTNDEKITNFKKAMKDIMEGDANQKVKDIAKTFYDNPVESMKMLQSVAIENSQEQIQKANKLIAMSDQTANMLKEVRNTINMSNPKALEYVSKIGSYIQTEEEKINIAQDFIKDVGGNLRENNQNPQELSEGNNADNIRLDNDTINSGKELIKTYINLNEGKFEEYKDEISEGKFKFLIRDNKVICSIKNEWNRDSGRIISFDPTSQKLTHEGYGIGENDKGNWVQESWEIHSVDAKELNEMKDEIELEKEHDISLENSLELERDNGLER